MTGIVFLWDSSVSFHLRCILFWNVMWLFLQHVTGRGRCFTQKRCDIIQTVESYWNCKKNILIVFSYIEKNAHTNILITFFHNIFFSNIILLCLKKNLQIFRSLFFIIIFFHNSILIREKNSLKNIQITFFESHSLYKHINLCYKKENCVSTDM